MKLTVVNQSLNNNKVLEKGEVVLTASLKNSVLRVSGKLPAPLKKYLTTKDVDGLQGDLAIKFFALLSASRYASYDAVNLEGVTAKQIKDYLNSNFEPKEVRAILLGIDNPKLFAID